MKFRIILILVLLTFFIGRLSAQGRFELENPSFEIGILGTGQVPAGWIDLGYEGMTPVDIQPGFWEVFMPPQDGDQFVGMVVRDNNTWEGIGQKLKGILEKDSTYTFSIWLAKSTVYKSRSMLSNGEILNFKAPTILKVWGYNSSTGAEELMAESLPIGSAKWTQYTFELTPQDSDYDEIELTVYYAPGHEKENGNLLIDNCSDIIRIKK